MSGDNEHLYPLLRSSGAHSSTSTVLAQEAGEAQGVHTGQTETQKQPTATSTTHTNTSYPRLPTRAEDQKEHGQDAPEQNNAGVGLSPEDEGEAPAAERAEGQPEEGFVVHKVLPSDNLISIAVQYNTSITQLQRYNASLCLGVHLDHVEEVRIPLSPLNPLGLQMGQKQVDDGENSEYRVRKAFVTATSCDSWTTNFYLREHNFDLAEALRAWRADQFWSLSQEFRKLIPVCDQATAEHYLRTNHCNFRAAVLQYHRHDWELRRRHDLIQIGCCAAVHRLFSARARRRNHLASYELLNQPHALAQPINFA